MAKVKRKSLRKVLNLSDGLLGFDTETTGIIPYATQFSDKYNYFPSRPFAFSFCDAEGNTVYRRWEVNPFTRMPYIDTEDFEEMQDIFGDESIKLIGHNIDFDIRMCEATGFKIPHRNVMDTMFMAHVVTGGNELTYALKPLCKKYLSIDDGDQKDLIASVNKARRQGKKEGWNIATTEKGFGNQPNYADYWLGDPKLCKKYAVTDAERTMMLYLIWADEIKNNPNFKRVLEREMRLFWVVKDCIETGVTVYPDRLKSLREEYLAYANKHLAKAKKLGGDLNFNSPPQMVKKFFIEKGYKPLSFGSELKVKADGSTNAIMPKKYPDRNPKCDGDFLLHAATKLDDKLAYSILEYKAGMKMINSFLDPYELFRTQLPDGRWVINPGYKQMGTKTGRLSCSDPNLMQVASETTGRKKSDLALRPREAFGPRPGYVWYLPDFSQMEVWVFAFTAKDETMMQTLLEGRDFHGSVAEKVWGNKPDFEENKSYYRKRAKLLMFCKLYGGGTNKVAYLTDSTPAEAKVFVKEYETELPGVRKFMDRVINRIERDGFMINPLGRTYFFDKRFAYKGVNYMIQGSCADLMKNAMVYVHDFLNKYWKGCKILLTLHDELMIEVPEKYHSLELMRGITRQMQRDSKALGVPVPLPIGVKIVTKQWNKTTEITEIENEWKRRYINVKEG